MSVTLKQYIARLKTKPQNATVTIGKVVEFLEMVEPDVITVRSTRASYDHDASGHAKGPEIMRLRAKGLTFSEIGKRVGLSKGYAQRIAKCIEAKKERGE
jgi:hypothetical protein